MRRMILVVLAIIAIFGSGSSLFAQEKSKVPGDGQTQEVVAEGVGSTADEAIKDAYRNAVRQVVGAVVDAETLVKNDELIDDKVLTYSDGFIKGYEEVDGSKKVKDGLHRIKIKAQVERRSVIAKLKAANVTMKQVDGKGLFAESITQLEAENEAAEMLEKQFEGFPQSYITATVKGKPEVKEKNADGAIVRIVLQVEVDPDAYKGFTSRVIPILSKLATDKGEFTADFAASSGGPYLDAVSKGRGNGDITSLQDWIPKAFNGQGSFRYLKSDALTLAVASNQTRGSEKIEYKVYHLDPSLRPLLASVASRRGKGKLSLLDESGESISVERFDLVGSNGRGNAAAFAGTLISAFGAKNGRSIYESGLTVCQEWRDEFDAARKESCLYIVSPTFFASRTNSLAQMPQLLIPIELKLSLDELKSVQDAQVSVNFDE